MNPLVGLFFGSFNPLHNGHFKIAEYLLDAGYCTEVWFVVSPQNPWKVDSSLLDEKKRLELPRKITNVIKCKNPRCITSVEQGLDHVFILTDEENQVYRCQYCEEKYK